MTRQTPRNKAERQLMNYLEQTRQLRKSSYERRPGATWPKYFGIEDFVLRHGLFFNRADHREFFKRPGIKRQCYANAGRIASVNDDFVYVEGFAFGEALGAIWPIQHAWLSRTGAEALDHTWRLDNLDAEDQAYLGVPMTSSFVRTWIFKTRMYGVLDVPFWRSVEREETLINSQLIHSFTIGENDNASTQNTRPKAKRRTRRAEAS